MTVAEAVQLVVQAGAIGQRADVLILDMGAPVRIADVARRLIVESGRPIEIVYTGLRPGEKIHEALFASGEADDRPAHPMISHAHVPPLDPGEMLKLLPPDGDPARQIAALARLSSLPVSGVGPRLPAAAGQRGPHARPAPLYAVDLTDPPAVTADQDLRE
jgi:hypothetical protein